MDYWKAWTPDPRYTFGLEEWNGSAVMNQTFMSYEEENATFTTLPTNWLTWLYSGLSEDLANQTTYESCPTDEIANRYYNTTWSVEFQYTKGQNETVLWPHKDMFKYNFHTSDVSEWDELEFYQSPPNPTYYERNRVTEYLTWRPIKREDFITTKRQPSTWTELYYTNNSAEGLWVAPTVYWIDLRTPSKRTPGSWEQVETNEATKRPTTLPPYPNPPINFTCHHCNGTRAFFSHENNLNNHIVEHMKNGTYKLHYNSSEERRANELPTWDDHFMFDHDSELRRKGITQTRVPDCTYLSAIDYSYEMRDWNQSFIEKCMKRHNEGKPVQNWHRDSVVYNYYYEQRRTSTIIYDSDYYYNTQEWEEVKVLRKQRAEKEKIRKSLSHYMSQNLTTFPGSIGEPSAEFEKKRNAKYWNSLEAYRRELLRNLTRTTLTTQSTTSSDDMLGLLKDLATIYAKFTSPTPTTTRKRRPFILQDQIDQYVYSLSQESLSKFTMPDKGFD
ncbi:uncharacterized protein LOC103512756 isoform X1 [Diaphorina citri]|uniref:Uncharacterized protein LOC103512756 isoform X1 n=1 Tax=Diaphorina citri TaxID=121845 RepID=A0A1S4EG44_DIACI|nr:uncharacterized protein LOC103512756 isoform X2 [Diaphorina citri]XP_008475761.1 uncharacterized protein LOC103512756 isoform X1 [Diaphorina citri]XP_017301024.1 uncharacterized protein LOC103512756 isoform X1 [Diaphorina citri]XP_017301026.1 uncharacterized protein LOC103512756 isoform X1 [Diaphorina citri]XP_017301027.1 uncharacterized protein LOC103512756 isoform X1 [Diaphorina citri]XP_026681947.1 uncharacterized protein LOC103512756 isoform X1 [Diaphorina citri]XP_026681948.1 uncharac